MYQILYIEKRYFLLRLKQKVKEDEAEMRREKHPESYTYVPNRNDRFTRRAIKLRQLKFV